MNYSAERLAQVWAIEICNHAINSYELQYADNFYVLENYLTIELISGKTIGVSIVEDYEVRIRRLKHYEIERFTELQAAYDKGISDARKIGESHGI